MSTLTPPRPHDGITSNPATWPDRWLTPDEARARRAEDRALELESTRTRHTPTAGHVHAQSIAQGAPHTPQSVRAFNRYGRRRVALQTVRDLAKLAGFVLCGIAIPFLAYAGIWLAWAIFGA